MARTRTLAELREEVRQRADVEDATAWLPNAELTRYINQSIARLYDKITQADEGNFVTLTVDNTSAGSNSLGLAGDFYKLIHVEVDLGGDKPQALNRWSFKERHLYGSSGWVAGEPIAYRLTGSILNFMPTPEAAHALSIWYIPAITDLADDADTFDGRNGWEEWVVLDAAIKVKAKEETDIGELVHERDALWADICPSVAHQDQSGPDYVQDVESSGRGWP
jgi:hypothetical protein